MSACLAALIAIGSTAVAASNRPAEALDGSAFQAGNIISDQLFYNSGTMDSGAIQSFLNARYVGCSAGSICLRDYATSTPSRSAEANLCSAYTGSGSESAAQILANVAQACGINPQVLLVMLQKESGLITATAPSYQTVMGFGCPDTSACNTQYYGFFNQVYLAARQFRLYRLYPTNYGYVAGRDNSVLYNPNRSCGSSLVYIQNQATAGLYNYTPYQPNAAALANLGGSGDSCSTYGNRNFWVLFNNWFGPTTSGTTFPAAPPGEFLRAGQSLAAGQSLTSLDGRVRLTVQFDGNIGVFSGNHLIWSLGRTTEGRTLVLGLDGNLALVTPSGWVAWTAGSAGSGASVLAIQSDGNLVLYTPSSGWVWATHTRLNRLEPGQSLTAWPLSSLNGRYSATITPSGNFVVSSYSRVIFQTATAGTNVRLTMSPSGSFALGGDAGILWAGNFATAGSYLLLTEGGGLELWAPSGQRRIWASSYPASVQPGQTLYGGERIQSPSGAYQLVVQPDGNIGFFGPRGLVWMTLTQSADARLVFETNGNLVLYSAAGAVVWQTNTGGATAQEVRVTDTGIVWVTVQKDKNVWAAWDPAAAPR